MVIPVSPELQNWLLQWAVAWYWSWKILACRGSCKLGLLQLAVALVLVDGSSCLSTAVGCRSGTVVVAKTVEIVVFFFGAWLLIRLVHTASDGY